MSLKRVFDPKINEVTFICSEKEPNRQQKYFHWTWVPFEGVEYDTATKEIEASQETVVEEEVEVREDIMEQAKDLTELHKEYEEKFGKLVSNRYKYNENWIREKLQEVND